MSRPLGRGYGAVLRDDDRRLGDLRGDRWTAERCEAAMRLWFERYGEAPHEEDWHPGAPRYDKARHATGEFPSVGPINRHWGTFGKGRRACGLPDPPGRWHAPARKPRPRCPRCGGEKTMGTREDRVCGSCNSAIAVERFDLMVWLRAEVGWTNLKIAEALRCSPHAVARVFERYRALGYEVPPSPYWLRGRAA